MSAPGSDGRGQVASTDGLPITIKRVAITGARGSSSQNLARERAVEQFDRHIAELEITKPFVGSFLEVSG